MHNMIKQGRVGCVSDTVKDAERFASIPGMYYALLQTECSIISLSNPNISEEYLVRMLKNCFRCKTL